MHYYCFNLTMAIMMLTAALSSTAILKGNECCPPIDGCNEPCCPRIWAKSQIGVALEERPNFLDYYLYWNQLIKDHWFYELRLLGIHNFIVNAPPIIAAEQPTCKDERNVNGIGGVGIFGYVFTLNDKFSIMPFFRPQIYQNTGTVYEDKFHNSLHSISYFLMGGVKLNMVVTDEFSFYTQFFGGYERTNYKGKGFFGTAGKYAHVNQLTSAFEFGAIYIFCKHWYITPYIQFIISDNNPGHKAIAAPYKLSGLTSSNVLWGCKIGYGF